jgi:Predicted metal-binding integral membrane protein
MTTWRFPPPLHMARVDIWSPSYALVMFFMWWIMMIAMMIPSATPTILLYGHAYRHEQRQGKLPAGAVPTFVFVLGYLLSWAAFSGAATGLQWGLERVALIHQMMMWSINPIFTAALLIAAGLYQLTPLKTVCLEHCRSPAQYLAQHFRPGAAGAFRLGWRHGAYCLGCCWFLMALLFAGGNHESSVDCGTCGLCTYREGRSQWAADCSDGRRSHGARWLVGGSRNYGA